MKSILRGIVAAALAFSTFAANASSYTFDFTSNAADYAIDGTLIVSDTRNTRGSYNILGISGVVFGDGGGLITGLVTNPNQPNVVTLFGYSYDNVFPLDIWGIAFEVGNGSKWNLWREEGGYHLHSYNAEGPKGVVDSFGTFSATPMNVTPVPEPETYAMLLAGLGLLGLVARRRKQQLAD